MDIMRCRIFNKCNDHFYLDNRLKDRNWKQVFAVVNTICGVYYIYYTLYYKVFICYWKQQNQWLVSLCSYAASFNCELSCDPIIVLLYDLGDCCENYMYSQCTNQIRWVETLLFVLESTKLGSSWPMYSTITCWAYL